MPEKRRELDAITEMGVTNTLKDDPVRGERDYGKKNML